MHIPELVGGTFSCGSLHRSEMETDINHLPFAGGRQIYRRMTIGKLLLHKGGIGQCRSGRLSVDIRDKCGVPTQERSWLTGTPFGWTIAEFRIPW